MDNDLDNLLSSHELKYFMTKNLIENDSLDIASYIISQYDTDRDGKLSYDEFTDMVLPAGNNQLKSYVLYHKKVTEYKESQLPTNTNAILVRILEAEIQLC